MMLLPVPRVILPPKRNLPPPLNYGPYAAYGYEAYGYKAYGPGYGHQPQPVQVALPTHPKPSQKFEEEWNDWNNWTNWTDWKSSSYGWSESEWNQDKRNKEQDTMETETEVTEDIEPKPQELALFETSCHQTDNDDPPEDAEFDLILEEEVEVEQDHHHQNNEDVIKTTQDVLQRHLRCPSPDQEDHTELIERTRAALQRHRGKPFFTTSGIRIPKRECKQRRSQRSPSPFRQRGKGKLSSSSKRARKRNAVLHDDKCKLSKVELHKLRYSQLTCKQKFACGRSVWKLVQDLLDGRVHISASFLRLSVFETTDEKTNKTILRCINNRRLFALKEYAWRSGKRDLRVNANFFSQKTIIEVLRFIQNSDKTDGHDVRLRET